MGWASVLSLNALSAQHDCGTLLSLRDPEAVLSLRERCEDAACLLRYDVRAPCHGLTGGSLDYEAISRHQLRLDEALRLVPSNDFRAWAVSLVRLSEVLTAVASGYEPPTRLLSSPLSACFLEAMEESPHPGDKALGLTNWLYAAFVAFWHQGGDTGSCL